MGCAKPTVDGELQVGVANQFPAGWGSMRVINGNLTSGKQVWRFTQPCRQLHMGTEILAQQSIEGQHLQGTAMLCPVHAPQGPSCRSEPSSLSHKNKTGI